MSSAVNVTTEPFQLTAADGRRIVGDIDTPDGPVAGRGIIMPAFGLTRLDLLAASYYLLANGFEVVRFDPTCHVGDSDGDIEDFRLSKFAKDIDTVLSRFADRDTSVIGISLSSRPAFRVLAGHVLKSVFLLSPVVNTRQTLMEVSGEDLVGKFIDGTLPAVYSILGIGVKRTFCQDCLDGGFSSLESALVDSAGMHTPTCLIVGSEDRWVAIDEVAQVAQAMSQCRLVKLEGANHQMFRSPVIFQVYLTALLREMYATYGLQGELEVPRFAEVVRYVNAFKRARQAAEAVCD